MNRKLKTVEHPTELHTWRANAARPPMRMRAAIARCVSLRVRLPIARFDIPHVALFSQGPHRPLLHELLQAGIEVPKKLLAEAALSQSAVDAQP